MSKKSSFKKQKLKTYRITLTLDMVDGEFDPHQIAWKELLSMQPVERCKVYVEDLDALPSWKS